VEKQVARIKRNGIFNLYLANSPQKEITKRAFFNGKALKLDVIDSAENH
jgi:hypothetical protein